MEKVIILVPGNRLAEKQVEQNEKNDLKNPGKFWIHPYLNLVHITEYSGKVHQ